MVGSFRSRAAAFRAVAETARHYGQDSAEVRSLVLFRQDGDADAAFVGEGEALVRMAIAAGTTMGTPRTTDANGVARAVRAGDTADRQGKVPVSR
jgi:hypothetical protein